MTANKICNSGFMGAFGFLGLCLAFQSIVRTRFSFSDWQTFHY